MTSQRTRNRLVQRLRDNGIKDESVLDVMAQTPRHLFVDETLSHRAYEDTALPIGNGQTISQYQFSPGAALGITSTVAFVADQRGQTFTLEGDTDSLKNGQCIMYLRSGGSVVRHWALMALHNCLE